jgi:hypothetical protein
MNKIAEYVENTEDLVDASSDHIHYNIDKALAHVGEGVKTPPSLRLSSGVITYLLGPKSVAAAAVEKEMDTCIETFEDIEGMRRDSAVFRNIVKRQNERMEMVNNGKDVVDEEVAA